jgi:hypothetical protein
LLCLPAIKTGRYTHAKRTRDILEVKALAEQPPVCPEPALSELNETDHFKLQRAAHSFATERRSTDSELSTYEIDEIIQQLTAVQARLNFWTPDVLAKQVEREKIYLVTSCCIVNVNKSIGL